MAKTRGTNLLSFLFTDSNILQKLSQLQQQVLIALSQARSPPRRITSGSNQTKRSVIFMPWSVIPTSPPTAIFIRVAEESGSVLQVVVFFNFPPWSQIYTLQVVDGMSPLIRTECTFLFPTDYTLSTTKRLYVGCLATSFPFNFNKKQSQSTDSPVCAVRKTAFDESQGRVAQRWQIWSGRQTWSIVSVLKKAVETIESSRRLKPQLLLYWQTQTSLTTQAIVKAMSNLMIIYFSISKAFFFISTFCPLIFLNSRLGTDRNKKIKRIVKVQERQFRPMKPNMYKFRKRQQQKNMNRQQDRAESLLSRDDNTNRHLYFLS